ncbi:hypothetical protein AB0P15_02470 [Streptomyces sp. NPDC087917]|uniref:SCO4225 family membrane protein n=1 Tax=Streptomyces sp. NPDC087917 TaxID=3155060 RepID=UPI0034464ACF
MVRGRGSKLEVWVPAGYLAVVVGSLIWVEVLSRTGDAGFAGIWPLFATAPLSILALLLLAPGGQPEASAAFGFYGAVLVGAAANAALIWALVRLLVRRRRSGGPAPH